MRSIRNFHNRISRLNHHTRKQANDQTYKFSTRHKTFLGLTIRTHIATILARNNKKSTTKKSTLVRMLFCTTNIYLHRLFGATDIDFLGVETSIWNNKNFLCAKTTRVDDKNFFGVKVTRSTHKDIFRVEATDSGKMNSLRAESLNRRCFRLRLRFWFRPRRS